MAIISETVVMDCSKTSLKHTWLGHRRRARVHFYKISPKWDNSTRNTSAIHMIICLTFHHKIFFYSASLTLLYSKIAWTILVLGAVQICHAFQFWLCKNRRWWLIWLKFCTLNRNFLEIIQSSPTDVVGPHKAEIKTVYAHDTMHFLWPINTVRSR